MKKALSLALTEESLIHQTICHQRLGLPSLSPSQHGKVPKSRSASGIVRKVPIQCQPAVYGPLERQSSGRMSSQHRMPTPPTPSRPLPQPEIGCRRKLASRQHMPRQVLVYPQVTLHHRLPIHYKNMVVMAITVAQVMLEGLRPALHRFLQRFPWALTAKTGVRMP